MKKILVTGAAGYIGSVLVRQLLEKGYSVRGLDILNFGGESLLGIINNPNFEFAKGDIRKKQDVENAIQNIWGVIHLAAIVGDPACSKRPKLAERTNWVSSKMIYDLCNDNKNIKRFIFASTCSNYGKMRDGDYVNEKSDLSPVSLYAKLKVMFEEYILQSDVRKDFIPTILRFSTVYGISPRMRFDLTVNEFIRDAFIKKELIIFGEQFWRPYCHVEDLARACCLILESDSNKINHNVFNVGDTNENYQKKMIADEILRILPETEIKYIHKNEDPRDYKVDFSKIRKILNYRITKRVPDGLNELLFILKNKIITNTFSSKYRNI